MAVTNGWGQGVENNTIEWGKGSTNNTNNWGSVYGSSAAGDTLLSAASFSNAFSLETDGVDQYVDCGVLSTLNGLSEASLSCWVYLDASGQQYLLSQWETTGGSNDNRQFALMLKPSASQIDVYFGSSITYRTTSVTMNTGQWYHIVATYNASNSPNRDKTIVYVNGTQYLQSINFNSPATLKASPSTTFQIGKRGGDTFYEIDGSIDEVSIFSKELSQSEITAIYNSGAPTDLTGHAGLVNWWRMGDNDGGTGTTITDQVGSNNGTLINSPTFNSNVPT
jgi:hypothetical protein